MNDHGEQVAMMRVEAGVAAGRIEIVQHGHVFVREDQLVEGGLLHGRGGVCGRGRGEVGTSSGRQGWRSTKKSGQDARAPGVLTDLGQVRPSAAVEGLRGSHTQPPG